LRLCALAGGTINQRQTAKPIMDRRIMVMAMLPQKPEQHG